MPNEEMELAADTAHDAEPTATAVLAVAETGTFMERIERLCDRVDSLHSDMREALGGLDEHEKHISALGLQLGQLRSEVPRKATSTWAGPGPEILRFFKYDHLPEKLRAVSAPFCELAYRIIELCPPGPEQTVALRKLLESKDAAVRAAL